MFHALQPQKTAKGNEFGKGEPMPEANDWDLTSIRTLVNANAMEWRGEGGKYGPHTDAITALVAIEKAGKPKPKDDDDEPVTHDELNAFMAKIVALVSPVVAKVNALEVQVGGLAHKAKGPAPVK